MKSSIFITSALVTSALAWPKPQLLDISIGLGGRTTVFSTVTVTKPAPACLPVTPTRVVLPQTTSKPVLPVPTTSKPPLPTTSKPVIPVQTTSKPPLPTTSKPVISVKTTSKPPLTPTQSSVPKPTTQAPRITGFAQAYLSFGLSYQAAILYHHNAARANHGAPPLVWDTSCEANARLAANTCNYAPYLPPGVVQGQNRYITAGSAFNVTAAITETWYKNEFSAVPWSNLASISVSFLPRIGELTQVLWKGTTRVGCASVDCGTTMKVNGVASTSNKYTVCNYAPAGNVAALFTLNIGRPLSTTNLGKWTD